MKVGLSYLGIFLVLAFLTYFIIYGFHVYETFQNKKEGFADTPQPTNDLQITKCPADSVSYINNKGVTLCCNGTVSNGKCNGNTICSLSESTQSVSTCSDWMQAYLEDKGSERCPASMPNYFESASSSGCTSGKRNKDGTGPLGNSFCKIYSQKVDDEGKLDSCTNHKLLEKGVCFNNSGIITKKRIVVNAKGPTTVRCSYQDKDLNTYSCTTDSSMERYVSAILPSGSTLASWKAGSSSWDPLYKLSFCSILEQYKINKALAFKDLESIAVYK